MQKQLIALAVLGALSAPAFAADNSVTLYGRVDMAVSANDDGKTNRFMVDNYSSRIGFKGSEDLGDGLSAVWQIETGIAPDDSANSKAFASRNSFIGLKGGFGTVLAGNHDTPFKSLDKNVSIMWGQGDALEVITHGKASSLNFHTRQTNVLQYHSPNLSGFQFKAAYSPDEAKVDGGSNKQKYSFSGEYDGGMFHLGAAYDVKSDEKNKGKDWNAAKVIGSVKLGDTTLGGAYSKLDNDEGKDTNTYLLAVSHKIDKLTLKGTYAMADETASNAKDGVDMLGLEANYALTKRTAMYGYVSLIKNEANAAAKFVSSDNSPTPAKGDDARAFGLGVRHNF